MAGLARRVADVGWSTLTIADHFDDAVAPIPGLMAASDATTRLRVGTMVLANDYRHPVVVAKEAATLDVLTGGRFELGINVNLNVGVIDQICDQLIERRERWGISYLGMSADQLDAFAP